MSAQPMTSLKSLKRLREELEVFKSKPPEFFDAPEFKAWRAAVLSKLREAYPDKHALVRGFENVEFARVEAQAVVDVTNRWKVV